jgi:N-glycosylase/DNA lyase
MPTVSLVVRPPRGRRLRTVVYSHGWFDLPPFEWDDACGVLTAVGRVDGRPTTVRVREGGGVLKVEASRAGRRTSQFEEGVRRLVRSMLGLDVEVEEFYRAAGPSYEWARRIGAGPFLRSASAFEDAVKMLATTNCSWSLTRQMVARLVETLGDPAPGGRRAFPTAERMAEAPLSFYRESIRAGYRSRYFRELAEGVARGGVEPESWPGFAGASEELAREIRRCPGLGRYAAENLCKLFGRFDGLGLDSWCLKKFPLVHGPVRGDVEAAIVRRYERYGRWKGLALWLDLTRDWHARGVSIDASVGFQKT